MKRPLLLLGLFLIVASLWACADPTAPDQADTVVIHTARGDLTVRVEVASTPGERGYGLKNRESLPDDGGVPRGMLFLFPEGHRGYFTMEDTLIPLDMIFVDETGTIFFIERMTAPQTNGPYGPADGIFSHVIEVRGGLCDQEGIAVGDAVSLRLLAPFVPR